MMKAITIFLWFLIFVNTGCVQTQPSVRRDEATIASINERAKQSKAKITFENGKSRLVNNLNIDSDSLSWINVDSANAQRMPISSITTVAFVKKRSALKNGLGGAILGALGGGVAGYGWAASMRTSDSWGYEEEIYGYSGAIIGAGAGGLAGMLIAIPRGVVYEFEQIEKAEKKGK